MATPTVRRRQLGNELRRVREAAGRTPTEASRIIDCNSTKISRLELGQSGIALGDLKLLLEFYGDDPEHIEWMIALSRNNRERGRWTGYRAAFPQWFRVYVDLEHDAEDIRWTELELVPGILQTEAYMRALFASSEPFGAVTDVDEAVRARQERQEILDRDDPPMLSFILSEACLRRIVGGRQVMAEQLEHLVELAARPRVQLQIRPFDAQSTTGVAQRFTTMRIPSPGNAPSLEFVYCEDLDEARYIDDKQTVRAYDALWGAMQAAALGPVETRRMLRAVAQELREGPPDDPH